MTACLRCRICEVLKGDCGMEHWPCDCGCCAGEEE